MLPLPRSYSTALSLPALLAGFVCFWALSFASHAEEYLSEQQFLAEVFEQQVPPASSFWLTGERKTISAEILQHPPTKLRQRYWQQGQRSAWIMEEIGKEKPITVGIVVQNQHIERVQVLAFRESRGWEIRYPFFVKQYNGAALAGDNALSKPVDNITGATLSVRAVNKLARLALLYHSLASPQSVTPHVSQPPR